MTASLKTFQKALLIIQKRMTKADAKFTMRAALLLLFILDRDVEPASYDDIEKGVGIEQSKAVDMTKTLMAYGMVLKTTNSKGYVAFAPTPEGLQLKAEILAVTSKRAPTDT